MHLYSLAAAERARTGTIYGFRLRASRSRFRNLYCAWSAARGLASAAEPCDGSGVTRERARAGRSAAGAALGLLAVLGCTPVVSEVHARAVRDHLAGLSQAAHRVSEDAAARPRCLEGESPVAVRAADLAAQIAELAQEADDHADGDWPSFEAFQEAMSEISELQGRLALLRAEYDGCRALSRRPADLSGIPLAPGARRFAVLDVVDPGSVVDAKTRALLSRHLRTRLAPALPIVDPAAVRDAQLDWTEDRRCDAECALAVAREVGAHKSLVVRVEKQEDRCAVVLEVFDLSTGIMERTRTVRQGCSPETIIGGIEDAVAPLVDP